MYANPIIFIIAYYGKELFKMRFLWSQLHKPSSIICKKFDYRFVIQTEAFPIKYIKH